MENLGIDYKLLIAQVINFGILLFLFSRFIAKPFLNYLQQEKKKDVERDEVLSELQTKRERMLAEEEEWRKKIRKEQEKALNETKATAEKMKTEILAEAKSEADSLLSRAKQQIEEDRENFQKEVKTHIADLSVFVIEKALQKYLTADVQKKLTDHIVTSLKKGGDLYEN